MTDGTNSEDRLRQIESILASVAEGLAETRAIVNSNARAIEATNESISTLGNDIREGFAQTRAELERESTDVVSMIGALAEETGKTQESVARTSESVNTLATEGKQQRGANSEEHSDFRALMHSTLAEVARLFRELRNV